MERAAPPDRDDTPHEGAVATDDRPSAPGRPKRRGLRIAAAVAAALVALFFGITAVTGLEGPGMLRRYPYTDLQALADDIDGSAGDLRTPDDCWRTTTDATGPIREIVRVDYVRSRVVVRAYAAESGMIDRVTFRAITDRVDEIIAANPDYSWRMVQIEPSPDGWSPLVSCRLVTSGWVTGF